MPTLAPPHPVQDITELIPRVSVVSEYSQDAQDAVEAKRAAHVVNTAGFVGRHAVHAADMQWSHFRERGVLHAGLQVEQDQTIKMTHDEMLKASLGDEKSSVIRNLLIDDLFRSGKLTDQKVKLGSDELIRLVRDMNQDEIENFIWVHTNHAKNMQKDLAAYLPEFHESFMYRLSEVIAQECPDADVDFKAIYRRLQHVTYSAPDYLKAKDHMADDGFGEYSAQTKHIRVLPVSETWDKGLSHAVLVHETLHSAGAPLVKKLERGDATLIGPIQNGLTDPDPERELIDDAFVQWLTNRMTGVEANIYREDVADMENVLTKYPHLKKLAFEAYFEVERGVATTDTKFNQFYNEIYRLAAAQSKS